MRDILGNMGVSEVALWFVLIFLLPMIVVILRRLRRYENLYGPIGPKPKRGSPRKSEPEKNAANAAPAANPGIFPYKAAVFLDPAERKCRAALAEAFGDGILVLAKPALRALAESVDPNPGYVERLNGLHLDFLAVDERTGQPFTALRFEPEKGAPRADADAVKGVCEAIGLHIVFIPRRDEYGVKELKNLLGLPDLDI